MTVELVSRLPRNDDFAGNNRYRALVRCTRCSNTFETGFYSYEKAKSCRPCMYDSRKAQHPVSASLVSRCRKDADRRGKVFAIEVDDVRRQYLSQILPGETSARCFYSGRILHANGTRRHNISIDRYDSELGYTPDNIVLSTKEVNVAKHVMSESRMLFLVSQMTRPSIFGQGGFEPRARKTKFQDSVISGDRFASIKGTAKARGIEFSLGVSDIADAWTRQDGRCAFSGEVLFEETASVDRVDNTVGYAPGNIQLVTKDLNFMRHELSIEEFRELVDDIYEWNFINNKTKGLI